MKRETIEKALMGFTIFLIAALLCVFISHGRKQNNHPAASAKFCVSSNVLQQQFANDEQVAAVTYLNSTLAVDGVVRSVEKDDRGYFTVMLGDTVSDVLIRCSVDKSYNEEARDLHKGVVATFKGICKGLNADKLAGLNVVLTGCSIHP